jgi:superfamily II DNA or RNA helicase
VTGVVLRDYQVEALKAIEREHASVRSTLLVLATGLGKTTVFAEWIRRRLEQCGGRAVVVAHREELISQAAARIRQQCPGLSVGIEMAESRCSTLAPERVVVTSVQTASRPERLRTFDPSQVTSVVIDEAHHATARSYRAIIDHLSFAQVLGVTATPDRGDRVGLGSIFESCAYQLDMLAGIERGFLVPIRVSRIVADDVDLRRVRVRGGDLAADELDRLLSVESTLHQIASPLVREARDRQTIVFTPGVQTAHELARVLAGYVGPGLVAAIDGGTPREERAHLLARYKAGDLWCIVNCAVLTEGFDAPSTSCVVMARPTRSRALYAQCVGRGTRPAPNKQDLLVLDFVGSSEDHTLCTPLDVLGGEPLDDETAARARRRMEGGEDVVTARRRALDEVRAEREARERAERERREREERQARITADVRYARRDVDPWRRIVEGTRASGPPATPAQIQALARLGYDTRESLSRTQASRLIDDLVRRARSGMATYRQARWLLRHGYPDTLSREQASRVMDAWARNGWQRPARDPLATKP